MDSHTANRHDFAAALTAHQEHEATQEPLRWYDPAPAPPALHFAGLNTALLAEALEGHDVLVSYADVLRRPGVWDREVLPRLEAGRYGRTILDSGAFTEFTEAAKGRAFHVDLEAYAAFIETHGHLFDVIVNLDDIGGDLERSWRNQERLEETGHAIVPVFHGEEPWAVLDHYAAKYARVALGFARNGGRVKPDQGAGLSPAEWQTKAFQVIAGRAQVHGLAMTRQRHLHPFESVDSTTWISEFRALGSQDTDATHSVNGESAEALGHLSKLQRLGLVLRSYTATGRGKPDHLAGARGQARTVLNRFTRPELSLALAAV